MADATVPVAAIAAGAAIFGGAVSPLVLAFQKTLQGKRAKEARLKTACLNLRRSVASLRTRVANNHDYHGDEMASRLAQVRADASDAAIHAFDIAMNAPRALAAAAQELAIEAESLVVAAEKNIDLDQGRSKERPDFTQLDKRIAAFTTAAIDCIRNAS